MEIKLNVNHSGVDKIWFWGGSDTNGNGADNISILFKNGHEEKISVSWEEKVVDTTSYLISKAESYINGLNNKPPELTDQELLYASEEDWAFYNEAIEGLPTREGFKGNFLDKDNIELPYGSGPHILKYFREALEITKARCVLEVGFNVGHGAAMLLQLGAMVDSIDISEKWETKYAALYLEVKTQGNFRYYNRSELNTPYYFHGCHELIFIDGAHDEGSIVEDIRMAKRYGIPYLLFDDFYPRYGETQKAIAQFPELELIKDMNNLMLFKWKEL